MMTLQEMDALLGEIGEQLACRSWAAGISCGLMINAPKNMVIDLIKQ